MPDIATKKIFENDKIAVWEMVLEPGESTGVHTHEHSEWLPIIENSQDMSELAVRIRVVLTEQPNAHGLLLHKHGLYSWGKDLSEARRHIEILEFLLEALGRTLELRRQGN